jgi:acetyltransferase-like isoleucine patch superfamily enzyme
MHYDVGPGTYFNGTPKIRNWDDKTKLKIGRFCSIADGLEIFLGGNHPYKRISQWPIRHFLFDEPNSEITSNGDVCIENEIWIGSGVIILSGVTIHNGAVIGAKSVVTKNVPSYAIVAGNPARIVGYRFSEDDIKILEDVQWWNWDINKIKKYADVLCSNDVKKLLEIRDL